MLALGCHPGLAPSPWSAGVAAGSAPAEHAQVRTLNEGYRRTKSAVLVREVDVPTRANLDWAAYHSNFMITDPEPEGAAALTGHPLDEGVFAESNRHRRFRDRGFYSDPGRAILCRSPYFSA